MAVRAKLDDTCLDDKIIKSSIWNVGSAGKQLKVSALRAGI